jgi:AcrR family transcriptional regulator
MKTDAAAPRMRGRPRQFDREAALDIAMRLFWSRGFETTSIQDLSSAIGINTPSLYAAFGDKKRLFREAVGRYCAGVGGFAVPAMSGRKTARAAIESLLLSAAEAYTNDTLTRGCMVIHAGVNCTVQSEDIAAELAAIRHKLDRLIIERVTQGQSDGDVANDIDTEALGLFYAAVLKGMSTQARDGASCEALRSIACQAMKVWP